jgi:hypothetical protein
VHERVQSFGWVIVIFVACCASARAFDFNGVQVHGFATQGLFWTSHNRMFGRSDNNVSPDFTELGLNGSWSPLPKLRISMQVLSRRAGKGQDGTPTIDFGLLDYSPWDTEDFRLGVRLGRVRLPYGIYNDTRDVAFTRPSILLPQSIYFERTRNLALSADGAMFYGEARGNIGTLTAEFGATLPRLNDRDTELAILGPTLKGHLESDVMFIGRLLYESQPAGLRLAFTGTEIPTFYHSPLGSGEPTINASATFSAWILSAQYQTENWTFTSEYALRSFKRNGFGPTDGVAHGESYYFQAAYRFAPKWEFMGRYDALYNNRNDPYGYGYQENFGAPSFTQFAQDWTVGLRYDVTPSIMTRLEYHNVTGTGWLPIQDNPDRNAAVKHWDMVAFLVSFRF